MAYMTGWRIGSLMSCAGGVDLETGTAMSRAETTRAGEIRSPRCIRWWSITERLPRAVSGRPCSRGMKIDGDYGMNSPRFKTAAAVKPATGPKPHYGFHDLRRAFATMNADKLSADTLQALMQHKDYQTTQRYINMARQLTPAIHNLFVPTLPTLAATGTED